MKKEFVNLSQAPWADQKVGSFIRLLAWIFIVCGIISLLIIVYFSFVEGVSKEYIATFLLPVIGISYFSLLFGHVAIKGKAPSGWLPWKK